MSNGQTRRFVAAVMVLTGCAAAPLAYALTAPEPSEVPLSWQLDIELHRPQPARITIPGEDEPRIFWYVRYTVTNNTGADQFFVPEFVLYTDTGQVLRAGQQTPAIVFRTLKERINDPLLKDQSSMIGKLLQGSDNAKDGIAIWPDFDSAAGAFDIFIGGLSGETAEVKLPTPITVTEIDSSGQKSTVTKDKLVLSKTLQLRYEIPGEAAARTRAPLKQVKKLWVMR